MKVYLAGGWFENEDDWRYGLVDGLKDQDPPLTDDGSGFWKWVARPKAAIECLDYVGPFPEKEPSHSDVFRCKDAIDKADLIFYWIQNDTLENLVKVSYELGYAAALNKFIGFGSVEVHTDAFDALRFPFHLSSFDPHIFWADTPKQSLHECLERLLGYLPLQKVIEFRKSSKVAQRIFGDYLDTVGYVYIIRADTGSYKIGKTRSVPDRMKLFTVKLPFQFEIISYFPCDNMHEAEISLHQTFAEKRINGEWFSLTDKEADLLKSIRYARYHNFTDEGEAPIDELGIYGYPWYTEH